MNRRAAFVTGAAQGIGAAIALGLARDGFDVAISARQPGTLASVAAALTATGLTAY